MSKKIPKASKKTLHNNIKKANSIVKGINKVSFSFEALERTEYFNLDGTCNNWPSELFNVLKEISTYEKKELVSGHFANSKYRIHAHENAKPPSKLPDGIELKDLYQIRIEKSKGGIHGVFYEDIFYIIWLDPLHNMYPDSRYGGLRIIKPPSTCCKDRDLELEKLSQRNKELEDELMMYIELLEKET